MSVLDIVGLNLFVDARSSSVGRVCGKNIAASAVDKYILVARELVEPVGTGEENSRLTDVELELVVSQLVGARQRIVCIFRHGRGSEERRSHLGWIQRLHHLVRVDQTVVAAGGGGSRDGGSTAVAAFRVAQSTSPFDSQARVVNFSGTPEPGREVFNMMKTVWKHRLTLWDQGLQHPCKPETFSRCG